MIRVGIIGLGFMGGVHLRNWQAMDDVEVVAVCDANPIDGVARLGNMNAGSVELNLDEVAIFTDVSDMLAAEKLDGVSVTLPTHLHKSVSIQCLEAGFHVLCEKPMALNIADCDAMIAAAKKTGKHLMIAHCIRFWPEYAWVKKTVETSGFGKVLAADFSRLTYAPSWGSKGWLTDPLKSGGIALDLHIHDLDFIQYLFGTPGAVHSVCSGARHVQTRVDYNDDSAISATASWQMPESFGFEMSFRIVFERAAAVFDGSVLTIYPADGDSFVPELDEGDGYTREIEYFAELISGKNSGELMTPEQARESVRLALETTK